MSKRWWWSCLLFVLSMAGCLQSAEDPDQADADTPHAPCSVLSRCSPHATPDAAPAPTPVSVQRTHPEQEPTLAMASSDYGLALFQVSSSKILARARTTFPVQDLVYDPWRDRWIAFEYEDGSANQISVWRVERDSNGLHLIAESTLETEGFCRLAVTRHGLVVFEQDGLQQRWLGAAPDLRELSWSATMPSPASIIVREARGGSSLVTLTLQQTTDEPFVALSRLDAQGAGWQLAHKLEAPGWASTTSPARIASSGAGSMIAAQMVGPWLRTVRLNAAGHALAPPHDRLIPGTSEVEDLTVDPTTDVAFVLLSGTNQLVAIPLQHPDNAEFISVSGHVPSGAWSAMARLIAFDRESRTMLVATNKGIDAWVFPEQPGQVPAPKPGWTGLPLRWPLALQLRGS